MRRPENLRMEKYLAEHGIQARAKYMADGSMKGSWRLYNHEIQWYGNPSLINKLNDLGFRSFRGAPLNEHHGNGGKFSVFVVGHNEFVDRK